MSNFIVKFLNLTESTIEFEGEYSSLMDALTVCKNTNLSNSFHRPAMSDEFFNEHLLELLISSFVYVGTITEECPDGEIMIQLSRDGRSVYSALPMPISAVVPNQPEDNPDIIWHTYTNTGKSPVEEVIEKKAHLIQSLYTKQNKE